MLQARWFFQQLIIGLDYCHKMGVVNRDIKLENTLLDGGKKPLLKICDFGYSKNEKDSLPKSKVGTPGYTGACLGWGQLSLVGSNEASGCMKQHVQLHQSLH